MADFTVIVGLGFLVAFFLYLAKNVSDDNEAFEPLKFLFLAIAFGFVLILVTGLGTPTSYRVLNETNIYSPDYYSYTNDTANCVGGLYDSCCEHDTNTTITGNVTTVLEYEEVSNGDSADLILGTVFPITMWVLVLIILFFLIAFIWNLFNWMLTLRKKPKHKTGDYGS